jgi:UDP-N-acetylglucosamine diphosphorylase/glucosamine-1-phosphate N-acetyltransferase
VSNVVFFANANKGHDGFLGNAVIGEWCNLGADTNCSNLKNNYDIVKIWDESQMKSVNTGLQFCGLLMGDHSKCGINTMFNTGTVVGVSCNIYGGGFPKVFIPSFSWGGSDKMMVYAINKAIDTANRMMERRNLKLSDAEKEVLQYLFEQTENTRALMHVG